MAFVEQFFEIYISVLESTKYMSGGMWDIENGRAHRQCVDVVAVDVENNLILLMQILRVILPQR